MIVKLNYEGWQYFEGDEIQITHGQSFLSNIEDDVICLLPQIKHVPAKGIKDDFGVTIITIINGSDAKRILIPYKDVENRVTGYLLNNEGKTIDKI